MRAESYKVANKEMKISEPWIRSYFLSRPLAGLITYFISKASLFRQKF